VLRHGILSVWFAAVDGSDNKLFGFQDNVHGIEFFILNEAI